MNLIIFRKSTAYFIDIVNSDKKTRIRSAAQIVKILFWLILIYSMSMDLCLIVS